MITVALMDPKYAFNVGAAVRAAACLGAGQVLYSGSRVQGAVDEDGGRLPREERLRDYRHVEWRNVARPLELLRPGQVPVAVELVPGAELMTGFEHPESVMYVFGPEDGTLSRSVLGLCHRFVKIPTVNGRCTNLGAAVYITLYDRLTKCWPAGRPGGVG